jgi:hypothetical protein
VCSFVLATLATVSGASAQTIGYSSGVSSVRGTYPTDRIESVYVFNSVDLSTGPIRTSASVPFVRQRSTPDALVPLVPGTVVGGTTTGFGDPLVRLDVRVIDARDHRIQVTVAGSAKLGMVSADSGLGTGASDYAGGGSFLTVAGGTTLLVDALFWKYGDPEGIDFKDSVSYSVGVGRALGHSRWSALVSLAGFSASIEGLPPPLQLNVGVLTLTGRGQSVAISAGVGLNAGSSDFSVGASWRIQR